MRFLIWMVAFAVVASAFGVGMQTGRDLRTLDEGAVESVEASLETIKTPVESIQAPIEFVRDLEMKTMTAYFTENLGQLSNPNIRYYSHAGPVRVGFGDSTVYLNLVESLDESESMRRKSLNSAAHRQMEPKPLTSRGVLVKISFEGSNLARPEARGELPHRHNYFHGNDPAEWRTNVRNYQEVIYPDLYDGIDLVYRAGQDGVKYEFLVGSGVDSSSISMRYEGVQVTTGTSGELVLHTGIGDIHDSVPLAFEGERQVPCTFSVRNDLSVGFSCDARNPSLPLVIDPLIYSTFLGGSGEIFDESHGIAVDKWGNAYVIGSTPSSDFPTTPGAYDTTFNGPSIWGDVFVAKIDPDPSGPTPDPSDLLFSTFLGGDNWDEGISISVNSTGVAYLTGGTCSGNDFPTTSGAYDRSYNGGCDKDWTNLGDAFVAVLSTNGDQLIYSTFLGGSGPDTGNAIAIDSSGRAYVGGHTRSSNFPTTNGAFDVSRNGATDAFIAKLKLDPSGPTPDPSDLLYSTFLGGSDHEYVTSIAVDSWGYAYVTGNGPSSDFPTTSGAYDTTYDGPQGGGGPSDAFIAKLKLDPSGPTPDPSDLLYSTFLGGSSGEFYTSIALDSSGLAYVTGCTSSEHFPTTSGAYDTTLNSSDLFVVKLKLDPSGPTPDPSDLLYSTFLGGTHDERPAPIALDSSGRAYVTGSTGSDDFPTTSGAYDTTFNGPSGGSVFSDAFVAKLKLDPSGPTPDPNDLLYSTFVGGGNGDRGLAIALDSMANPYAYVAGSTSSDDLPMTDGAFDVSHNGNTDAFVVKIAPNTPPTVSSFVATTAPEGSPVTFTVIASDAEGDPLTYSYDFESDGVSDLTTTSNTATHVYLDDFFGTATVEVNDGQMTTVATATVTVYNVAPTATIDSVDTPTSLFILPGQTLTFTGSYTDPGILDTQTVVWFFGDEMTSTVSLGAGGSGTFSTDHAYMIAGSFEVILEVTDDDLGVGTATTPIVVASPQEAADILSSYTEDLPESNSNGLAHPLSNAAQSIERGNTCAGCNQIDAYLNQIRSLKNNGHLDPTIADFLILHAEAIKESLGCS